MNYQRVLAIGAHTDDIEIGCGALLSRLADQGCEVSAVAFSRAEQSLPPEMPRDILEREFRDSMRVIGVEERVYVEGVPVRHFPAHRQDILERLVALNREWRPDLVLTMNSSDTHQDHQVVHEESVRAFRGVTVLGYEIPWNQQQNVINLFAEVSERDVSRKVEMLAQYRSQIELKRSYISEDYVRSAAVFRGFQARRPLAEAYEVITMQWDSE